MNGSGLGWNMKIQESIHINSIRPLLLAITAICLLGFTGCNSLETAAGKGFPNAFIGKLDPQPNQDVVAANRDWYQLRN
jgi:hypothetical protein